METAKIIQPGFSTADADYPVIRQENDELIVKFNDWRESEISVNFLNVIAFKWQTIETLIEGEAYDQSHEIENSVWLKEHYRQGVIEKNEVYKHFKLNFNACGQLEILASGYEVKT